MNYDNTNRGQFWRNEKKEKDTHPDWTGSINIDGVEYWLSGWSKKPDAHPRAPSVSLSFKRKEEVHKQGMGNVANTMQQAAPQSVPHQGSYGAVQPQPNAPAQPAAAYPSSQNWNESDDIPY